MADYFLDITDKMCPITFVKTKLLLERMAVGETAEVRLRAGEPLENVPRSLEEMGQELIDISNESDDVWRIKFRKSA